MFLGHAEEGSLDMTRLIEVGWPQGLGTHYGHTIMMCVIVLSPVVVCRLSFLSSVVAVFSDRLMLCPAASKIAFCNGCVRYCIQH